MPWLSRDQFTFHLRELQYHNSLSGRKEYHRERGCVFERIEEGSLAGVGRRLVLDQALAEANDIR